MGRPRNVHRTKGCDPKEEMVAPGEPRGIHPECELCAAIYGERVRGLERLNADLVQALIILVKLLKDA